MKRVLLTGAAGDVGSRLRRLLPAAYPDLLLSDLRTPTDLGAGERFQAADLADLAAMEHLCQGVDGIVHLGGFSVEGPWDQILQSNIVGLYNTFEAARRAGVRRVVFASSNHAVGFYRRDETIPPDVTVRPDSRYGVSKVFGEAMGALYADKHGLDVFCIRIGNVGDKPIDVRRLSIWLHPEDLVQLIRIGLEHPDVRYEVVYGASDNARAWWDNSRATALGYRPRHRSEEHLDHALAGQAKTGPDAIGDVFQGGSFCSLEYSGRPVR